MDIDDETRSFQRVDQARILVFTSSLHLISTTKTIMINGFLSTVRIVEENVLVVNH